MSSALRKTALSVALLSLGIAMNVNAQGTGSTGTGSSAATPSSSGSTGASGSSSRSGASSSGATGSSSSGSRASSDSDKVARADRKFIETAAEGGMAEVQLGQLAAQKGQSDQVKQFGQKMVDDHTKANDQLKQIASTKGVTLPTDLKSADKREMDRLSKLSGAEFDREYMKHMVSDHKKDVSDFQKEAKSGKDAEVKSFASQTVPVLQQHLQLAQSTDAAVRSEGRGNTARTSSSGGSTGGAMSSSGGTSGASTGMSHSSAGTAGSSSGTSRSGTTGGTSSSTKSGT